MFKSTKDALFKYQQSKPLEERKTESARIRRMYADRIPVIIEKVAGTDVPEIDKNKFLVPSELTISQLVYVVRKRVKLTPEKAIFLFCKGIVPNSSELLSKTYEENKDEDGFLYLNYCTENTFG